MDFFELMFGGGQAIRGIFKLGFIPKEESFREFTAEEYTAFHEKGSEDSGKMYTFKSEQTSDSKDIYAFSEEEKSLMLKGAQIIKNMCEGKTFVSDEETLQYVASRLPSFFTMGSKYEKKEK